MPVNPIPLTKPQRTQANAAARLQIKIRHHEGVIANLRDQRDVLIGALIADGVRPFVVAQETGCPARLPEEIRRDHLAAVRNAATLAGLARRATRKGAK